VKMQRDHLYMFCLSVLSVIFSVSHHCLHETNDVRPANDDLCRFNSQTGGWKKFRSKIANMESSAVKNIRLVANCAFWI